MTSSFSKAGKDSAAACRNLRPLKCETSLVIEPALLRTSSLFLPLALARDQRLILRLLEQASQVQALEREALVALLRAPGRVGARA